MAVLRRVIDLQTNDVIRLGVTKSLVVDEVLLGRQSEDGEILDAEDYITIFGTDLEFYPFKRHDYVEVSVR